jgi:hypothetical protein
VRGIDRGLADLFDVGWMAQRNKGVPVEEFEDLSSFRCRQRAEGCRREALR